MVNAVNGKLSLLILVISQLVTASWCRAADPIKVTFLNPDQKGSMFWDLTTSFMEASAKDLGMQLDVVYSPGRNRFEYAKLAEEILTSPGKPDYLVGIFKANASRSLLKTAEREGVKCLMINTDVPQEDRKAIGKPRVTYKSWIGQMVPNDNLAGYRLAKVLIKAAESSAVRKPGQKIQVIALTGSRDSTAALDRNKGLSRALEEHPEAVLNQMVFTEWKVDIAKQKAVQLLDRYPNTHVIWCASDGMSLAAVEAIKEKKRTPGKDVFTGGVDWSSDGLKAVKEGSMTTTVGGHFMEGGWALVLLYDYHFGKDFADELGTRIDTSLSAITPDNIALCEKHISNLDWADIDFKKLSKVHTPDRQTYDFSFEGTCGAKKKKSAPKTNLP